MSIGYDTKKSATVCDLLRTYFLILLGLWMAYSLIYFLSLPKVQSMRGCIKTSMFGVDLCEKNKNYVPLARISKNMKWAVLASEDARFYEHEGFDLEALKESFQSNWQSKAFLRGGSTITQQLAKNVFLSSRKSVQRKLIEAKLTYDIEKHFSKDEILEKYLNVVEFGKNLYGISAAARFYFKKSASNLSILESAFLAMLLPNPTKYAVSFSKKNLTPFARGNIKRVLFNMDLAGFISRGQRKQCESELNFFPWYPESYPKTPPPEPEIPENDLPMPLPEDEEDFPQDSRETHLF